MSNKKAPIGSEFKANDGSVAKVVSFKLKDRAVVATYHPASANDFLYGKEVCVGNLLTGSFRSVDSPNKYGGFIGYGVYDSSHQRIYNAWYNTLRYAHNNNKKIVDCFYNLQEFARWYVSCPDHFESDWMLNYSLLVDSDCVLSSHSLCLLPKEIIKALSINKKSRIAKKVGNYYKISDFINLGLAKNVYFVSKDAVVSVYCRLKEDRVKTLAEQYKQQLPEHVYQALKFWKCSIDLI